MSTEDNVTIISHGVINKQEGRYHAWPNIEKTRSGELLVVFSGDRQGHVCPWGKVQMIRSRDNGATWSDPEIVSNSPLDDRDPAIIETHSGALLVTWPVSAGFDWWPCRLYSRERYDSWQRHSGKIGAEVRRQWLNDFDRRELSADRTKNMGSSGHWARRSTDSGATWSEPFRIPNFTCQGPSRLSGGRLGMITPATKACADSLCKLLVSEDDGITWSVEASIPGTAPGPDGHYGEAHILETGDNRMIALFRKQNPDINVRHIWQSTSTDGGRTWSAVTETGMKGYPAHMVRLKNGLIAAAYGLRVDAPGIYACISRDDGRTWDVENRICLSSAPDGDLGYPGSVELDDGSIYTVYYQREDMETPSCVMATHWRVDA